ncbi:MAG: succinate dehydrogenase, partial [Aurantibacter sp.]
LYIISFVLLALHLWHGFASSFQSMGINNKYSKAVKNFTKIYAVVIPLGFIFIALYHHLNPTTH